MDLTIRGTPKEIADLVVQVQGRQSPESISADDVAMLISEDLKHRISSAHIHE